MDKHYKDMKEQRQKAQEVRENRNDETAIHIIGY